MTSRRRCGSRLLRLRLRFGGRMLQVRSARRAVSGEMMLMSSDDGVRCVIGVDVSSRLYDCRHALPTSASLSLSVSLTQLVGVGDVTAGSFDRATRGVFSLVLLFDAFFAV